MKSGYYQIGVAENDKHFTAFQAGPLGFYEYERLAMGLRNSPATYQRLMEDVFGSLNHNGCLIYLDDIIVYSRDLSSHLELLQKVFSLLQAHNLKLNPKKCEFLKRKVKYLGHFVSEEGVEADPSKLEVIQNWNEPGDVDELRKFLGFAGYYRRYIPNFSKLSQPLSELLVGLSGKKRGKKRSRDCKVSTAWKWGPEQQQSFSALKQALLSPPVLAHADFQLPFQLHIDASGSALGAVLYQVQEGIPRVIAYASRSLNKAERLYPAHKLEFL